MSNLQFVKSGLGMPLFIGVVIPCFFIPLRATISSLTILLCVFALIGVVYAVVAYFTILDGKDKSLLLDYFHQLREK